MKFRKEEVKVDVDLTESLTNQLDLVVLGVNPELGRELIKMKKQVKMKQDQATKAAKEDDKNIIPDDIAADNFMAVFNQLKTVVPDQLDVPKEVFNKSNGLKKVNRKELYKSLGIHVEE